MSLNENIDIEKMFSEGLKDYKPEFSEGFASKVQAAAEKRARSVRRMRMYKWLLPSAGLGVVGLTAFMLIGNPEEDPKDGKENKATAVIENNKPAQPKKTNENTIDLPVDVSDTLDVWETPKVSVESDEYVKEFVENNEDELNLPEDDLTINTENPAEGSIDKAEENVEKADDTRQSTDYIEPLPGRDLTKNTPSKSSNVYPSFANTEEGRARYEAYKLNNGALLVRLKTYSKTINELEKRGYTATARKKREEVKAQNMELYKAFKENFSFADLYFFYATDSEDLINKKFEGAFLNENLEKDPTIKMDAKYYCVADIGQAVQTQSAVKEGEHRNGDVLDRVIVISNSKFNQMEPPFPYYQKASWPVFDAKNIRKMNSKLYTFLRGY